MKKILLLLALATIAATAADKPFSLLEEVTADPYAEVANRIEYQNMVLLPDYTVIARHYYLAPMRATGAAPAKPSADATSASTS